MSNRKNLHRGFRLGDFTVYPLEGRLVDEKGDQRVQPKSMDVLLCLAESAGTVVQREDILRQVWGDRAQTDDPLTRCIGDLRRALGDTRSEPEYILTIPKRGYRLLKSAKSLVDDEAATNDRPPTDETGVPTLAEASKKSKLDTLKKIAIAAGILMVAALVEVTIERLLDDSDVRLATNEPSNNRAFITPERSIAVLPFVTLSSGEDDGYFADGLTEEILNALTQLPELRVTARTSSFFFKGKNVPASEIAARLNVAHLVEGSVRRDSNRLRITAQLIRASDDTHLWSASYDRTLGDVFAVQEDIAENIAEVLGVVLDDDARRLMRRTGIRNVEAFIDYQKGLQAWVAAHTQLPRISEPLVVADAYFDRALEAVPGLTMARIMKADRRGHIILEIASGSRDEQYPGEAQDALDELLEEYDKGWQAALPGNQRDILDLERTLYSNDWSGLRSKIERALRPGGCPQMNWTKIFIAPFGWAEQLVAKTGETLACNPMDAFASYNLPWSLILAGDADAALQAIEDAENKGIQHPWLEDARYLALLAAGRVNALTMRGPGPKGSNLPYDRQILREALAGDPDGARQMAEEYWSKSDVDDLSSLVLAAVVGDRERANKIAAKIDMSPGSAAAFSVAVLTCFCGAPFDLEATPNYKARIEEAGLHWPPPKRIDYATKTW